MRLVDVNVLVYAYRTEEPNHSAYAAWVSGLVNGDESYAVADSVINGFVRVVTNHRIYRTPAPIEHALVYADRIRNQPHAVPITPGRRHWGIFEKLCRISGASGALIADVYLAALAIEHGCEVITADKGFARFPGLRWRHPV
ncbi:type II toxin-antitoxin system VapC family toxin [Rhizohabitans arisaemae]|uniref:type II toxin-antitoxin system VapC family toxin n=1 Tax=Rhizohabitans arisaemae TaxID=2720610 RepID=UPI0024B0BA08|nr:type II toxin-antitoxin system VapC family toxin [Rhizohabitans arisaemae]